MPEILVHSVEATGFEVRSVKQVIEPPDVAPDHAGRVVGVHLQNKAVCVSSQTTLDGVGGPQAACGLAPLARPNVRLLIRRCSSEGRVQAADGSAHDEVRGDPTLLERAERTDLNGAKAHRAA